MSRLVIVALILMSSPAMAQEIGFGGLRADVSAPVEVAADSLSVQQESGHAVFTGNVVIGQGEMRLSAQEVTVEYADAEQSRIKSLRAKGNVTLVSGEDAAEAAEASYDVEAGKVTLLGDVVMTRGENVLTGNRMQVDLATGTAQVDGRVRSVLQPGGN